MESVCFSCQHENPPDHVFCSACGSPLSLTSFIALQVDARVAEKTKDSAYIEEKTAAEIFKKAYGWAKLAAGIWITAGSVVVLTFGFFVGVLGYNAKTFLRTAQERVESTANNASVDTANKAKDAVQKINQASGMAIDASRKTQTSVTAEVKGLNQKASALRTQLQVANRQLDEGVSSARRQLGDISQLRPQFESFDSRLKANSLQLSEQQALLTDAEEFAKKVFSTHQSYLITPGIADKSRFQEIAAASGKKVQAAYVLLPYVPIAGTLQCQIDLYIAPPNSYFTIDNLVVILFDAGAISSKAHIAMNYFPATKTPVRFLALEQKDGRVFVNGMALPKFGQLDPTFVGSPIAPAGMDRHIPSDE